MSVIETAKVKMGRPRSFCEQTALTAAMHVFWEKGYEGTSLTDLTDAMGMNRASLYATFGDKEALFRKALIQYEQGPAAYLKAALEEPTARRVIEALLNGAANFLGNLQNPRGCLATQGALATGSNAQPVKTMLTKWRRNGEGEIQKRLKRAKLEGEFPDDVVARDLAQYVCAVMYGLQIMSANGDSRADLVRVVDRTLRTLPI